jgi:branched-chain amino acid transport system substrate-binding protein
MMRKFRKHATAIPVLLCLFGLPGCERSNEPRASNTGGVQAPVGDQVTDLKVGCITILSGDVATYGKETKQGIDLAIEEANASGKLDRKRIVMIYEDSQLDAKTGTQAISKLISVDKVPIIIGPFSSRVMLAIAPIAERSKTVLLSASATADSIKDTGDYIFRIVPPNKAQGTKAADFAVETLKLKKAAVFHVNDEYGVSLAAEFRKAFETRGGEVVFYEGFAPGQRDFRTTIQKIRGTHPDFVFFPGQAAETGLILKQSREIGLNGPFVGGDGSYSPDLITIAGNAAEGTYYTLMAMGYGVSDDMITDFETRYRSRWSEDPTVYAAYAYEAGRLVADILSRAKYEATSIKDELLKVRDFKGITGLTTFDTYGEVDKAFYVYIVHAGKFVIVK